jgi:hypothetical protein
MCVNAIIQAIPETINSPINAKRIAYANVPEILIVRDLFFDANILAGATLRQSRAITSTGVRILKSMPSGSVNKSITKISIRIKNNTVLAYVDLLDKLKSLWVLCFFALKFMSQS